MKREPEVIRQLLLDLEACETRNSFKLETILKLSSNKDAELVAAHVRLMLDAGLLTTFTDHYGQEHRDRLSISNSGYDFLDSVRDDEVWRKTKAVAEEVKSTAIETFKEIAKGFVTTQLKKLTGVDI